MSGGSRTSRSLVVAGLLGASALGLAGGFVLKAQCTGRAWDGFQYRRSCYSDVYALYFVRDIEEGKFPYLSADLEYPVGTGLYIGAVGALTGSAEGFVALNGVGLALMGLGGAAALAAMAVDARRVLLYAIGPAVVLYAFHNWDLLAVGFATLALFAFWRRLDGWAGLLLGLGASTKLYPLFLLPVLALARWREEGRPPWRMGGGFLLGAAVLNLPVLIADAGGWWHPWAVQSARFPNFETSWYMAFRHLSDGVRWWAGYPTFVNFASLGLFVLGVVALLVAELRRPRERMRPYALCFGVLLLFLLTAKVFSPQYALWLLPFFVLLRMPWHSYLAFAVTDAAVWFAASAYFLTLEPFRAGDPAFRLAILEVAVWARYAVLAWLLWRSRGSDELVRVSAPVALTA